MRVRAGRRALRAGLYAAYTVHMVVVRCRLSMVMTRSRCGLGVARCGCRFNYTRSVVSRAGVVRSSLSGYRKHGQYGKNDEFLHNLK